MSNKRVYIRGCGAITAVGNHQEEIALACHRGIAMPGSTILPHCDEQPLPYYALPNEVEKSANPHLYPLINSAVDSAVHDAGLTADEIKQLPVFVGSTAGDISDLESHYQHALKQNNRINPIYRSGFGVLAEHVINRLQSNSQAFTFNTACSSSANALLIAMRMIALGRCENALILGVETRNQMSLQGFNSMMLLSPKGSQPFDKAREGTVLGEGVGAIILSRHKPTSSSFMTPDPYYCMGGTNLVDSVNVTSSSGAMIAAVIQQALNDTATSPADVDIIKAHGTSTPANDSAEAEGMRQVFEGNIPPFTSLKPYLGHTLGACGVLEAVVLLACIKNNFIPATPNFTTIDEACGCAPLTQPHPFSGGNIMLNHFGFGGNNTSLIISNRP